MKNKERTIVYSLLAVSIFLGLDLVADKEGGELTVYGPDDKVTGHLP